GRTSYRWQTSNCFLFRPCLCSAWSQPMIKMTDWRYNEIPDVDDGPLEVASRLNSDKPKLELPCPGRLVSAFASELGGLLKNSGMYQRGGSAFVINEAQNGLSLVTPEMVRTWVEQHVVCYKQHRTREGGLLTLCQTMGADCARAVLAAPQFLE